MRRRGDALIYFPWQIVDAPLALLIDGMAQRAGGNRRVGLRCDPLGCGLPPLRPLPPLATLRWGEARLTTSAAHGSDPLRGRVYPPATR